MSESLAARWEQQNDAGRRAYSQGHLEEAEEAFRAAAREGELLGAQSAQLATSLSALGQIRTQLRDYDAAEPLLVRALAIREALFGLEARELVPSLSALAALYEVRNDYDRADTLLRRALGISEHHLGPSHPEVSVGLNSLAKLYFKRRDFAKADRLLLRLLEIKRGLGKEHPEVATVLGSLAKLRQVVGRHEQGEQLWRQALAIRERGFAPNDPVIATTLENVADCCAMLPGRVAEAILLRERALAIRETSAPGPSNPALANARAKLAELRLKVSSDTAAHPEPAPRRSSKELPSPLVSHELPVAQPDESLRLLPSTELPWLQLDEREGISGQLDAGAFPTTGRMRTPPASVTPVVVPRQNSTIDSGFGAPITPGGDLVLSDSIAPEPPRLSDSSGRGGRYAPPMNSPHNSSGRSGRYVPPVNSQHNSSGRKSRYAAPDPESTRAPSRPRTPRVPASMSKRGSSKRLIVAGLVIVMLSGGAWAARDRLGEVVPFARGAELGRIWTTKRTAPAATPNPGTVATPAQSAAARNTVSAALAMRDTAARSTTRRDSARMTTSSIRTEPVVAKRAAVRDTIVHAPAAAADAELHLKTVPTVGDPSEMDAVTSNVEQSTKSKVESAQRPELDVKPPVFKKP